MLWDWVFSKLLSDRNAGFLAAAGALIAAGLFARVLSWLNAPKVVSTLGGFAVAFLIAQNYWVQISEAADEVRASIQANAAGAGTANVALRCDDIGPVLMTIKTLESGNQYDRMNGNAHTGATASGAYQYTNGTWNGHGGYRRAMDAPPHVQDERASADVRMFLERHGGDVSVIPVLWYVGHVPSGSEWDSVPWASQGNTLTPRQYQTKWLAEYERQTAACATEVK